MCASSARRNWPPLAEARMRGEKVDRARIADQIAGCFVEVEGRRTDIVVLACTHYPFLVDLWRSWRPGRSTWLDPAPAIARRVATVLEGRAVAGGESAARFTSGRAPTEALVRLLAEHGLAAPALA